MNCLFAKPIRIFCLSDENIEQYNIIKYVMGVRHKCVFYFILLIIYFHRFLKDNLNEGGEVYIIKISNITTCS